MRLIHHTLTVFDAADEEGDLLILEEVLVGAQVTLVKRRREIIVKLPSDRLIVQLRTDREFDAWSVAFRDAARVSTNFYTIVASRQLGVGAFSTVYFGFDREDGHHVAIKVVDKTQCSRAELVCAETEARMMAFVRHPHIVYCRDIFDAPDAMHVVMEYMSGSTLEQRMLAPTNHSKSFSEDVAATVMAHIMSALAYLEREGICHRDVKPDNILLSTVRNNSTWATSARLSDFGLAAFVDADSELTDVVGTPHYVAPEVVSRDSNAEWMGYGPPVDVWAAGVIMFWMLTGGRLPFDGDDPPAIFKAVRAGHLNLDTAEWRGVSADAKALLRSLLQVNPRTRLRASAAIMHPWLQRAQDESAECAATAARLANKEVRAGCMSQRGRFISVARAVMAVQMLLRVGGSAKSLGGQLNPSRPVVPGRVRGLRQVVKKAGLEGRMMRAPERAPLGADGLGYNVGLIPSFTPKRRAKAGLTGVNRTSRDLPRVRGEESTNGSLVRVSRESGGSKESGSSGSRSPSKERGASMDRRSIGSSGGGSLSKGSWGLILRGRSSAEKNRSSFS